ncbi:ABC transporter substrate-binding protein [Enterocloster clostridioformis]|uniref:Carbohydrate ABC transporter substrate-binding protein, CUT1 family n=1 Tax=Enterocloster clostridioformis TaxID=1531 RepID=A0A1I0JQ68_9FIRM|nr:extracellular solute-binding protein [Enterocloster clostridioformis]SEU12635.1 carbohydrate ABC transporter substrate-binding protein, CUT1 family [Enterocloster clostridioformis]SEW46954.1 carbohydrate ABC transporter substrate-binding protein, CUT1 family [Enterocloster clostridioformis]
MKKRWGQCALAALLAVAVTTGCAMPTIQTDEKKEKSSVRNSGTAGEVGDKVVSADQNTDGKVTIRIVDWSDGSAPQRKEFHKKYMEVHPDINIEYTQLTVDQFKNTIVTMIKSGDGPDLFPIPVGMTLDTALQEDWFQPINDYVMDNFAEKFDPKSFSEGVTHKGNQWYTITELMPTIQCLFFYNKDVLSAAGVDKIPETYSEFREACKKITKYGNGNVYGLIDGGKQINRLDVLTRSMAAAAGGKIAATQKVLTDQGMAPYDTDAVKGVMQLFAQLEDDGSIHPDTVNISAPEARELFAQGQAGFLCQGMWCISQWGINDPDLNYGVMAVPVPDGVKDTYVQQGELSPWMGLYSQSKHPQEAVDYLMALYSEEFGYQSSCVEDGVFVSVIPEINEQYMTNAIMKDYYTIANATAKIVPTIAKRAEKANAFYSEVKDVQPSLGAIMQGVLSRSITDYDSALRKLAEDTTTEWKRACEAVGMDYRELEFDNWNLEEDYTDADYEALK